MATYYFRNSGNTNWNVATNWSTTDGGVGNGSVPAIGDDVFFTSLSGACTVTSGAICRALNFNTYTNTITMSNSININGNVTLGSSMNISGSGNLILDSSFCTITPNGKTWPNGLVLNKWGSTYTLASNFTVGSLTCNFTTSVISLLNGFNLTITGSLSVTNGGSLAGTTNLIMNGTGTIDCTSVGGIGCSLTINSASTITINTIRITGGTFTYTSGTINGTKSLVLSPSTTSGGTLNVSGITWTTFSTNSTGGVNPTTTLSSDIYCNGTISFSVSTNSTHTLNGGNIWFTGTTITHSPNYNNSTIAGTTVLNLTSSSNITHGGSCQIANFSLPIVINTSGTITLNTSSVIVYKNTFTINQVGTLVTTSNTFVLGSNSQFVNNVNGLTLNNVRVDASTQFTGSYGIEMNSLSSHISGVSALNTIITFTSNKTYLVNSFMKLSGSWLYSTITLRSSIPGSQATLTLPNNNSTYLATGWPQEITQLRGSVSYVNVTDIDSSGGRTLWTFGGILNNATNWRILSSATKRPTTITS
jgi:hypothetical protein